jgi:hypothetical protein
MSTSKYPKILGKTIPNTPKIWGNTPKIWEKPSRIPQKFGEIPQKFGKTPAVIHCKIDGYKDRNRLEIIYIILSNRLSNYRNRETCPKFMGNLGDVSHLIAAR